MWRRDWIEFEEKRRTQATIGIIQRDVFCVQACASHYPISQFLTFLSFKCLHVNLARFHSKEYGIHRPLLWPPSYPSKICIPPPTPLGILASNPSVPISLSRPQTLSNLCFFFVRRTFLVYWVQKPRTNIPREMSLLISQRLSNSWAFRRNWNWRDSASSPTSRKSLFHLLCCNLSSMQEAWHVSDHSLTCHPCHFLNSWSNNWSISTPGIPDLSIAWVISSIRTGVSHNLVLICRTFRRLIKPSS